MWYEWVFGFLFFLILFAYLRQFRASLAFYKQHTDDALFALEPELEMINNDGYELRNIGGMIVVFESNSQYKSETMLPAAAFGLGSINRVDSLVKLAMDQQLKIDQVLLHSKGVVLKLHNLTRQRLPFCILKGQVFEHKKYQLASSMVADQDVHSHLNPGSSLELRISALRLNRNLRYPEDQPGNVAIFKVVDDHFTNEDNLAELIERNIRVYKKDQSEKNAITYEYGRRRRFRLGFLLIALFVLVIIYFLPYFL